MTELSYTLRQNERCSIARCTNFGMESEDHAVMTKEWRKNLKEQEKRVKIEQCGSEAVNMKIIGDNEEHDDIADDIMNCNDEDGANLEEVLIKDYENWDEAGGEVI